MWFKLNKKLPMKFSFSVPFGEKNYKFRGLVEGYSSFSFMVNYMSLIFICAEQQLVLVSNNVHSCLLTYRKNMFRKE